MGWDGINQAVPWDDFFVPSHPIRSPGVYHSLTSMFVTCIGNVQLDFSLAHEMESDEKSQDFLDEVCADNTHCTCETILDQLLKIV